MLKWKRNYGQWTCEKYIPGMGTVYGEINEELGDEENVIGYNLEMECIDNYHNGFDVSVFDIKSLDKAKLLAEQKISKFVNSQIKKLQKHLK